MHPPSIPAVQHRISCFMLNTGCAASFLDRSLPSSVQRRPNSRITYQCRWVIGHFTIGSSGKTDLALNPYASHLVVLDGKLHSGLSKGRTYEMYFDQTSRTVACKAEVLNRAVCIPVFLQKSRLLRSCTCRTNQADSRGTWINL